MTPTVFDQHVAIPVRAELGEVMERTDIRSSLAPFRFLPEYRIRYPRCVIQALGELYAEYNKAFIPSVEANTEWNTDYRYCIQEGLPVNFAVQIDMVGLTESFLQAAADLPQDVVREVLRRRIYEIENSLAMYQLMEGIFANRQKTSFFRTNFRATLGKLRKRFKKPIALLAVTQEKYDAMKAIEFGKKPDEDLSDEDVMELSGFDKFFGPEQFRRHVETNSGECACLLYARTSDPVSKLKNPDAKVEHPLLGDSEMRRIIKANVLTFNIDAPDMDSIRRINDTKEYQQRMGMAFQISAEADLFSLDFAAHLFMKRHFADFAGTRLSPRFTDFLQGYGTDPERVESGELHLRGKPARSSYGCYGHVSGSLGNGGKFRNELRRNLRLREGGYVIQPEMPTPKITNTTEGEQYQFIDRAFFSMVGKNPMFLGGFRAMMPVDSVESKNGRNHGNEKTVWAEIVA